MCFITDTVVRICPVAKENIVCGIRILRTDFGVAGYKMLVVTKLATFVSSSIIEEHGITVQQLDGLGYQH